MNLVLLTGGGTQGLLSIVIVYAVVIGVFWFFAIRPQKKQQKEHDALITTLEVGDSILTTSGFFGVVIDIMEEVVTFKEEKDTAFNYDYMCNFNELDVSFPIYYSSLSKA